MNRIADFCWEGLTLKHISHTGIIFSYILFFSVAFMFELFLIGLVAGSLFWFNEFGHAPNTLFYICVITVLLMITLTIPLLVATIRKLKNL